MRVLLVNGSPHEGGNTFRALSLVASELEREGIEAEWFQVGPDPVRPCVDCGYCKRHARCAFGDDKCNALIEAFLRADAVVIGTPIYFASANGSLCALLDRVFYALTDTQRLLEGKLAAGVAVGWRAGSTSTLDRLNRYFTFASMPVVGSFYWNNILHRDGALEEDEYGLRIMKGLGQRMAGLLKKLN